MKPDENNPKSNSEASRSDEIFVLQPKPKEPVSKKAFWLTIGLTITGIVILIVVFFAAIVGSAGSLASDYQKLALVQIKKINNPIKDLEPSEVLNNRDIDSSLNKIYVSKQAQPNLESTLFFADLNSSYVIAKKQQTAVQGHYMAIDQYSDQLQQLLEFDDGLNIIMQKESEVVAKINVKDSLSLRTASGSYQSFADEVKKLPTPDQLSKLSQYLVQHYQDVADLYTKWAAAVESGDNATINDLQAKLQVLRGKTTSQIDDKNFVLLFQPTYTKIVDQQKTLESSLSN
jgi:hypothetical protein